MMRYDILSFGMNDHQRYFSSMSCLSNSTAMSLTSVAGLWLTSVIAVSKTVAAAVVTDWISRTTDALAGCLTKTSQPDFFSFQVPVLVCHPPRLEQTVTDMAATSVSGFLLAYRSDMIQLKMVLSLHQTVSQRGGGGGGRRLWKRCEDTGRELTSCQSTLRAWWVYCTVVTPSGEYSAGRRWVLVLHVGDIITAWAVTPRDAKLNQADSPAALGSSGVYSY